MLRKLYHYIQGDTFLRNNIIFFIGSLFVAFLNYLYYPVMGRLLSVEEFGEVQTIFSLTFISGVVLTVFRMIVLNIATNEEQEVEGQGLQAEGHRSSGQYSPKSQACPAKRESNLSREVGVIRSKVDTNTVEGHMSSGLKVNTIHTQSPSEIVYSGQTFDLRPSDFRQSLPQASSSIPALYTLSLIIHAPFLLILLFASQSISRYFSFESNFVFSMFSVYLLLSIYQTFYTAYLHGKSSFHILSVSNIIGAGGKLVLSFLLVYMGFGVLGAVGALVLISLVTLVYMKRHSHELSLTFTTTRHVRQVLQKEIPYGLLIFISLGFVTVLYSLDVIIVKRLFSPEVAGLYSGIATIARIIFFATGSISGVLLPTITLADKHGKNVSTLLKATFFTSLIGVVLLLFFTLFPAWTIHLLIGKKYVPFAPLLASMSLYLFFVSLLNLFVSYLLALRSWLLYPVIVAGALILTSTLYLHHESVENVIFSFTLGSLLSLVLAIIAIWYQKK